ncbi:MAG: hypothetical protein R3F11_25985 [Verrucomicrobiales bacterium]
MMLTEPAGEFARHVWREGFDDVDPLDEVGGEEVELDSLAGRVGGGDDRTVDERVGIAVA